LGVGLAVGVGIGVGVGVGWDRSVGVGVKVGMSVATWTTVAAVGLATALSCDDAAVAANEQNEQNTKKPMMALHPRASCALRV